MTNTTYYHLHIVEGSDIVNPLTVDNPNYEKIDETMHNNAVSGVTLATEIANATVHAITRENSECAVIRFIATSVWKAGDTVTVDGVPVTALLPSGETLPDGAYVINSNVLCILTGTNMTVFAERKKTDTANDIEYHGTNVEAELDKINRDLNEKTKWKYLGFIVENGKVSINGEFNELLVCLMDENNGVYTMRTTTVIPFHYVESTPTFEVNTYITGRAYAALLFNNATKELTCTTLTGEYIKYVGVYYR